MRWVGHVAYKILVRRLEGTRLFGRLRHIPEDNIRMDLKETGWGSVNWMHLAQDNDLCRDVVNTVINLRFP
jgi:hypothetical protein